MSPNFYKPVLVAMMSYLDDIAYNIDHNFSENQLGELTPADVLRWLNYKTYGDPEPDVDANPIGARSNSIKFYKKAISWFMPNKLLAWNSLSNCGNPTRSIEINELIKRVKKKKKLENKEKNLVQGGQPN